MPETQQCGSDSENPKDLPTRSLLKQTQTHTHKLFGTVKSILDKW